MSGSDKIFRKGFRKKIISNFLVEVDGNDKTYTQEQLLKKAKFDSGYMFGQYFLLKDFTGQILD